MKVFWDFVSEEVRRVFEEVSSALLDQGFYLAGGTALALEDFRGWVASLLG